MKGAANVVGIPVLDGEVLGRNADIRAVVDEHAIVRLLMPLDGDETVAEPDGREVDDSLLILRRVKIDHKCVTRRRVAAELGSSMSKYTNVNHRLHSYRP